jgi:DNA repair exonuclease SbcCD nuclease subunit
MYDPKALLLTGDLFDTTTPSTKLRRDVFLFLDYLQAKGTRVAFIEGNHDDAGPGNPPELSLHPWPIHLDHTLSELGTGVSVYGFDNVASNDVVANLNKVPVSCQILLAHQAWREWMGGSHTLPTLSAIPHAKICVTGDLHIQQMVTISRDGQDNLLAISPGCGSAQGVNEDGPKGVYLIDEALQAHVCVFPTRPLRTEVIKDEETLSKFLENVKDFCVPNSSCPAHIAKPILRVKYSRELSNSVLARIKSAVGDKAHLFTDLIDLEDIIGKPNQEITVSAMPSSTDLATRMSKRMDIESKAYSVGMRLLDTSRDLKSEVRIAHERVSTSDEKESDNGNAKSQEDGQLGQHEPLN